MSNGTIYYGVSAVKNHLYNTEIKIVNESLLVTEFYYYYRIILKLYIMSV